MIHPNDISYQKLAYLVSWIGSIILEFSDFPWRTILFLGIYVLECLGLEYLSQKFWELKWWYTYAYRSDPGGQFECIWNKFVTAHNLISYLIYFLDAKTTRQVQVNVQILRGVATLGARAVDLERWIKYGLTTYLSQFDSNPYSWSSSQSYLWLKPSKNWKIPCISKG